MAGIKIRIVKRNLSAEKQERPWPMTVPAVAYPTAKGVNSFSKVGGYILLGGSKAIVGLWVWGLTQKNFF